VTPSLTLEEIGEVLRHARRARGLTQTQAAELAGIGLRLWVEVETGKRHVSITNLLAMLRVVRVEMRLRDDGAEPWPPAEAVLQLPAPAPAPAAEPLPEPARAVRSGQRIDTGTGAARRRLTLEEAQGGGLPTPFTAEEWAAMAGASTPRTPPPAPPAQPKGKAKPVAHQSPQLRALSLLASGMSTYRVASVMQLPFDVVHRWALAAREAAAA
jgi:transcriptional regulator with XRE-family HTH domain